MYTSTTRPRHLINHDFTLQVIRINGIENQNSIHKHSLQSLFIYAGK